LSNPDSFIDEVNEELKRDRLFALMKRYGWIAIVLVLGIVGWASWNEWSKAQARTQAEAFGDAVVAALDADAPAARIAAMAAIGEAQRAAGRDGLARAGVVMLLMAAEQISSGDRDGALEALQSVAEDSALPSSYRQLAQLKRVIVAADALPIGEREAALLPLSAPGQPLRALALEQLALLQLEAGARDEALAQFRRLLEEPELTPGLQQRVQQMIVVLGGDTDADLG
jgi:hypothetical protein